jgi:Uncharacterized conserved protein
MFTESKPSDIRIEAIEDSDAVFRQPLRTFILERRLVALVRLRLAQLHGCPALLAAGTDALASSGAANEVIIAVASWRHAGCFTGRERAALSLAEAMSGPPVASVPDDDANDVRHHFTEPEIAELRVAIRLINGFNQLAAGDGGVRGGLPGSMSAGSVPDSEGALAKPRRRTGLAERLVFRHMHTPQQLLACYTLMAQLRHDLGDATRWVARVLDLNADEGYRVPAAWSDEDLVALAGYRVNETLLHGRAVEVNDIVTHDGQRGAGIGGALLEELEAIGRDELCVRMIIDVPAGHTAVYRFLEREGLRRSTVGFVKCLETQS